MSENKPQLALENDEAKALIELAPALAGLTVSETQRLGVTTCLTIGLRIASSIGATPAENAPVFKA